VPRATLEEIQLRAMRAFVSELTKKKYGASVGRTSPHRRDTDPQHPRQRGRRIPVAVRRAVFERDGSRCTYLGETGARCPETHRLEFHHLHPFALGGEHTASNLTLRCTAHNALAAEADFGHALMEHNRGSPRG
jgi:5-methylcytosine-specific restriction endonuclease McrA